ncbi:hypothetical protein Btru_026846 [Bulinus truncatus]|nr:hypothetical protein Btru_026846 [Bulinus truncatus]
MYSGFIGSVCSGYDDTVYCGQDNLDVIDGTCVHKDATSTITSTAQLTTDAVHFDSSASWSAQIDVTNVAGVMSHAMATLTALIEMGKDLGYTGKELRDWVSIREAEERERERGQRI